MNHDEIRAHLEAGGCVTDGQRVYSKDSVSAGCPCCEDRFDDIDDALDSIDRWGGVGAYGIYEEPKWKSV